MAEAAVVGAFGGSLGGLPPEPGPLKHLGRGILNSAPRRLRRLGALVRMFAGRRPGLRSLQGALPALPLPPLRDTVSKAVESLQTLDPGGMGSELPPLARSFLGGPGPQIQRWLSLRGWALPSYLSELWEQQLHLGARGPLPSTGSYYLMDVLGPPPSRLPAARAANVAFAFLSFRSLLRKGTLPPVLLQGSLPTCSAQYERLFGTARIPGESRVPDSFFGVPRPPWARARALLLQGGGPSSAALRLLEAAPFVVAFDPSPTRGDPSPTRGDPSPSHGDPSPTHGDPSPQNGAPPPEERDPPRDGDLDAEAKALLLGPPHNRWFDKSLTLVVFPSGRVGLSVELSWGDPPVAGHLWEFALAMDRSLGYDQRGNCRGGSRGRSAEPPQELQWNLPPQVSEALPQARLQFQALLRGLQLHVVSLEPPPGPPEFTQELLGLALELALVRERGPALTYEPIPTRLFLEGRADGARGVGRPLLELERALRDPETPRGRRRALLEAALAQARARRRAAMMGAGLERHLQAMAAVANQMRLRPPFLAEVLRQPWALAFSPAPRPHPPLLPHPLQPAGGGFNPPHQDGYGVSFTGGGGAGPVLVHISCREGSPKTDPRLFSQRLRAALGELGELGELGQLLGGEG
ncbi:carnitine O-palmitoyltransferase 1, brain isoform-like [Catharus ustulatus]|uniref:carnitine O-palmitoyltransferase 1, brain isoform-like n=1 Tax=Catharus ustulatus TaxID=91951 RepID=UPI0014094471|nr:carnitine O-palmitoyltransferase 1, brain isoform-like [Catharus ustulatus]